MIQVVIFDMDGVLIDSQPFHFDADILVLKKAGIADAGLDMVKGYAGMSNPDRWSKYKLDYQLALSVDELIRIHIETINQLMDNPGVLGIEQRPMMAIDGVEALLKLLKSQGVKLAVASSSSYGFIYKVLDKIGLTSYFDIIVSGEDMRNSKPAPDIFLAAAAKLSTDPEECIIIEDSTNGVLAAYNAGIKCIGYINTSSGQQDLSKADFTTDSFYTLIEHTDWLG